MKKLVIIGAGDWALEVHAWIHEATQFNVEYTFKGFIDDNLEALLNTNLDKSLYLGTIESYEPGFDDVFICAIGNVKYKSKAINHLISKKAVFVNAFHNTVKFIGDSHIGIGVILSPYVVISNGCIIENHVGVNLFCSIGHNVKIGDFCQLSSHCDITGHSQISNSVFLGSRVTIIPGKKVISHTVLGAGSVVFRSINIPGTYVGNPAKKID